MLDAIIIFSTILLVILAVAGGGFMVYRRGLRFAKGVERGIKMVPILINLPPSSDDVDVGGRDVRDVIQERISQAEVLFNLISSTSTSGFKSKFFGQRHLAFELVAIDGMIKMYAAVPVALVSVIKQAILTAYPGAQLEEIEDHNIFSATGKLSGTYGGEIKLKQQYSYPIATVNQLKRDAMQAVIKSLTSLEAGDGASLQILVRPARSGWIKSSEHLVKKKRDDSGNSISAKSLLQAPFKAPDGKDKEGGSKPPKQLTSMEQSVLDAIEEKTKSAGYETMIRVVSSAATASRAQAITNNIVSAFSLFDAPGLNGFKFESAKSIEKFVTDFIFRFFPPEKNSMILNSVELATLFHLPDEQFAKTAQLQRQSSKQVEGPSKVSSNGVILGYNNYHGVKKEIRLSDSDRRRHVYIVGQTGTGKTTALSNMMIQDMKDGKGFAFVDPHGDEAEKLLGMVPPERSEDVIYFDPGNLDYPLGLNIFEYHNEDQKDFLIQEAINMLYSLYDPQHQGIIGPRYEHLFRSAALTVMSDPAGGTFVDLPKLFRDPQFAKEKLKHVTDQTVREFWEKEMPQSQRSNDFGEVISWFVSKFGAFLSNQLMRNTIGQTKSSFDLREVMDNKKILIANLSKGRLGELNSKLLGMIFVMKFQAAAMSRANVEEDQREDFSLYVDEFQNFSTESFAFILSEARKYRLTLVVANQFISQLSDEIRDAVFGNVGTIISYRTGPTDADFLVKQFAPAFNERDLINIPNFNAVIRLMSNNLPTHPFNIEALPPQATTNPGLAQAMKKLSSAKYAHPRAEVEKAIFERLAIKKAPSPFESLSSARDGTATSTGPAAKPASGSSPASGANSFLDDWLNKRRQTLQQTSASGAGPKLPPTPSRHSAASAASGTQSTAATPQSPGITSDVGPPPLSARSPQQTPAPLAQASPSTPPPSPVTPSEGSTPQLQPPQNPPQSLGSAHPQQTSPGVSAADRPLISSDAPRPAIDKPHSQGLPSDASSASVSSPEPSSPPSPPDVRPDGLDKSVGSDALEETAPQAAPEPEPLLGSVKAVTPPTPEVTDAEVAAPSDQITDQSAKNQAVPPLTPSIETVTATPGVTPEQINQPAVTEVSANEPDSGRHYLAPGAAETDQSQQPENDSETASRSPAADPLGGAKLEDTNASDEAISEKAAPVDQSDDDIVSGGNATTSESDSGAAEDDSQASSVDTKDEAEVEPQSDKASPIDTSGMGPTLAEIAQEAIHEPKTSETPSGSEEKTSSEDKAASSSAGVAPAESKPGGIEGQAEMNKAEDKVTSDPEIPPLKPGEIYIDDQGQVHRG